MKTDQDTAPLKNASGLAHIPNPSAEIAAELLFIFNNRPHSAPPLSITEIAKLIIDSRRRICGLTGVQALVGNVFGLDGFQLEEVLRKELALLMSEGKLVDSVRSEIVYSVPCQRGEKQVTA